MFADALKVGHRDRTVRDQLRSPADSFRDGKDGIDRRTGTPVEDAGLGGHQVIYGNTNDDGAGRAIGADAPKTDVVPLVARTVARSPTPPSRHAHPPQKGEAALGNPGANGWFL